MENTIKAILTFEMMGKPANYLKETMEKFVETLGKEGEIVIKDKKVYDPKKIENKDKDGNPIASGEIFSTFCEIELEAKNMFKILAIAFKYMPSHIEIIQPEEFKMRNNDFNAIVNEILSKLHNYDAIAKSALMNNQVLARKIQDIMQGKQNQQISQQDPQNRGIPLEISYGSKDSKENRTINKKEKTKQSKIKKDKQKKR